jgi:hypothetical protein
VDFHADAFVDFELVDTWSERGNRAHIFVAGREILVEGQAALNDRRRTAVNDLKVGCANATASMRTRTSARPGTGVGLSRSRSSSGLPSTHAFICSGTRNSGNVLTPAGLYIGAVPWFDERLPCEKYF